MGESAIMAAVAVRDPEDLRAALVGELIAVIPAATDPQTWDPRELGAAGGNIWPVVCWQEKFWFRDPDDATTDHDAITCIITLDGSRYLTNDVRMPAAVLSRATTAPPDPDDVTPENRPALGDAYLVPAASTDDWAAHEDEVALWTARGWRYAAPAHGHLLYIEDELGFVHYDATDTWEDGTGAYSLPAGSIRPSHLLIRSWQVENQTTTAPPANGPAAEQYIIGAAATGAWAGHDGKIAWRPAVNAAFVITAPFVGEEVYDKAFGIKVRWNGTAWVSAAGVWVDRAYAERLTTGGGTDAGGSGYAYDPATAPGSGISHSRDTATALTAYSAKRAGAKLRFTFSGEWSGTPSSIYTAAIFRGSESTPLAWLPAETGVNGYGPPVLQFPDITAPDTSASTYTLRFVIAPGKSNVVLGRRAFQIEEAG